MLRRDGEGFFFGTAMESSLSRETAQRTPVISQKQEPRQQRCSDTARCGYRHTRAPPHDSGDPRRRANKAKAPPLDAPGVSVSILASGWRGKTGNESESS